MTRIRTLVLVLAGGAGGRLELLTRERAKPAVPFAGTHRLIDFPLSNAHNAGLHDVWVIQQFNPISLSDHLANGRPWDLDRTTGGLLILPPRLGHDGREGFAGGTADALWRNAPMIREFAPRALVILSADAVYALDYGALVEEHVEAGAEATMVTTRVDPQDAGRYGVVRADGDRVCEYVYKPDDPASDVVSNEVFVFDAERLLDRVDQLDKDNQGQDLGDDLLPALVRDGGAREHRFDGFWRDVGTVDAYWSSHQELLADPSPIDLDDPAWPILTQSLAGVAPARVLRGAVIEQSLVAGSGVWQAASSARPSDAAPSSRRAPPYANPCSCPVRSSEPARMSNARSSMTGSRSDAALTSAARARSRSSGWLLAYLTTRSLAPEAGSPRSRTDASRRRRRAIAWRILQDCSRGVLAAWIRGPWPGRGDRPAC